MANSVILLSGGLDSLVALDIISKTDKNILALFFDYGQKAHQEEFEAFGKIVAKYQIKGEKIELSFLNKITKNALTQDNNNDFNELKSVWVPNRNGLFLNIAASYCDADNFDRIVFGANKEEGRDFSDNRSQYAQIAQKSFEYSTLTHPEVFVPCIDMDKVDLVNYMIDNNISFDLIKSCYQSSQKTNKKHCGECMSCKLLYNAIKKSKRPELIEEIF